MKNLDQSISTVNLDESFSNATGRAGEEAPMVLSMSPTSFTTTVAPTPRTITLLTNQPASPTEGIRPRAEAASIISTQTSSSVGTAINPLNTSTPNAQTQPSFPSGGGFGGGGGALPEEDEAKREGVVAEERKILGMKPVIAYVLGASVLVLGYLKFVKKAF